MAVYSDDVGVVPKGRRRQRNSGFTTITMHIDAIWLFVRMYWYAASRSVFPIMVRFEGNLMHVDAIMWSILRR